MKQRKRMKQRRRAQRGSALAIVLALLFAVSVLSFGLMSLVSGTMRMAQRRSDTTEAFNMADAGVDLALAWLKNQPSPPDTVAVQNLSDFWGTNGTISNPFSATTGGTLTVRIDPDATNPSSTQKRYLIEARAVMPGGATQIVRAYVQQASFGKYAFFCDDDGGGYWDFNNHFEGPFHSNDSDGVQTMILWRPNNTADPMFTYTGDDAFSVSGNVTWWKNNIGNTVAPDTASDNGTDFPSLAKGGQSTMTYGFHTDPVTGQQVVNSPRIPLPTTDETQRIAALGNNGNPSNPTANGVTLTLPGGGIFVHGDNDMRLRVDGSGNQQVVVTQGSRVQTVTLDVANNRTIVATTSGGTTSTAITSGLPNGVVYSDGNITSLQGTVADNTLDSNGNITRRSALTIATDIAAGKNVTLTDSLRYNTSRDLSRSQDQDTTFNTRAGTLGLLSHTVNVSGSAPSNIEFDGSIFATDTFQYANTFSDYYGGVSPKGTMTSIGGVIVKDSGLFAIGSSSGQTLAGYQEQYHYDNRLADHPPPFFPTTSNNYDVVSWQRVTGFLP